MLDKILSLPLEQKVGQLFFIGIPGTVFDAPTRDLLDEITPGGVCLFARNIRDAADVRALLDSLSDATPLPPFLSLDQEGGLVDRLRRVAEPMPAAAQLRDKDDAAELGRITAELLRVLGFNMNFAPVVDVIDAVRSRPDNGLFSRAFGETRDEVAAFAGAYLDALQSGGILGCLKHFPGLGAATIDSHEELPEVRLDAATFDETDIAPYRRLLGAGVEAVMIAHAAFPLHDLQETDEGGKLVPSSLSFNFTTKLLRETLGFEGLALTDDLEMGAIVKNYGMGEACVRAVAAGEDQLLICNNADAVREGFNAVLAAVRSGRIGEERLVQSLRRVAAVKTKIQAPTDFSPTRVDELSARTAALKARLK